MFSAQHKFGRLGAPAGRSLEAQIAALFPDVWYDPSDFSSLFQDAAGTTPVTALEQPVGLMLDKSRGLVLGPELVTNGDFSNGTTGWTAVNINTSGSSVVNGEFNVVAGVGGSGGFTQDVSVTAGRLYRVTVTGRKLSGSGAVRFQAYDGASFGTLLRQFFDVSTVGDAVTYTAYLFTTSTAIMRLYLFAATSTTGGFDNISVRELPGAHAFHTPGDTTTRPVVSRRINEFIGTETLATQNVTTRATNYSLRFSGAGSITLSGTATGTYSAGAHTITCTAGTLTATVSGSVTQAMLTPSDLAVLPYQRVNTTTDYDSDASKFPTFLRCDGANDGMQTNAIDFTGTDKMFVGAAVRKLSDAATGVVAELGTDTASVNGSFRLNAPGASGVDRYSFISRGTIQVAAATLPATYPAPTTNIVSGAGNISGDSVLLRVNGAQISSNTDDQGTGNYGNYKLYLFMRAGTSLPFNGWFFGSLIKGSTLSASQIALVERYLAGKTKTVVLA